MASHVARVLQGLGYSRGEKQAGLQARDPKGVPTLHTKSMCQRGAMAMHEEHEEQARGWGVFGRKDRTGQGLGQKERDIGDVTDRLASDPCGS